MKSRVVMHDSTLPANDIIAGMRFHCATEYICFCSRPSLNERGSGTVYIVVVILLSICTTVLEGLVTLYFPLFVCCQCNLVPGLLNFGTTSNIAKWLTMHVWVCLDSGISMCKCFYIW